MKGWIAPEKIGRPDDGQVARGQTIEQIAIDGPVFWAIFESIAPEKIGRPHDGKVSRGHAGEGGAEGEQVQVPGQVGQGGQVALW